MIISDDLKKLINEILEDEPELKIKLLNGDIDAIRRLGMLSQRGISAEFVLESIDKGDIDSLYKQANKLKKINYLYQELCNLYYFANNERSKEDINKSIGK